MARYPLARWRPVARYQPGGSVCVPMAAYSRFGLHTAVTPQSSLFHYFSVAGRATSHFFVDASGDVEQYIDTRFRSSAHLNGNHDTITVETQDMGGPFPAWSGSNVPAWTAAQVEALARLGAWLHDTHGIRLALCPDSRPGSKGFAWHRQGIDPWRVSGGEYWSKAAGKVCPGDRRVAQVPAIVARATQITRGDDDMPTAKEIADAVWAHEKSITQPRRAVLESPIGSSRKSLGSLLLELVADNDALLARVGALEATVAKLATGQRLSAEEITSAARLGAGQALDDKIKRAEVNLVVEGASE